jgi:outer membrane lipopolysaccharide assembly protein LptE/RlpB
MKTVSEAKQKKVVRQSFVYVVTYLLIVVFLYLACCGYSTRSLLPSYMQEVHVKLFENNTFKAGLDETATNAVVAAFNSGSNLRMTDESNADLLIEGKVSNYVKSPHTYTSDQNIIEYRITITFSARCVDVAKNEVFWEGSVSDWAALSADGDEDAAIEEATKKTAERLVTTVLTNW